MNQRNLLAGGVLTALSLALIALPSSTAKSQEPTNSSEARLEQRIADLQARLRAKLENHYARFVKLAAKRPGLVSARALPPQEVTTKIVGDVPGADNEELAVLLGDEGSSWLGVETHEVTADKAKELKLPAERGVVLGKIIPDSPAAKAGLKENDVVTEINGQRVEGAAQFRRMIREIPAGRDAQLTVWRDGHTQTVNVTLGKAEERRHAWKQAAPGTYAFQVPEVLELPDMPSMDWSRIMTPGTHPRLGIDAEDLSGQLGTFFGAPEGEGVLVREVNASSAAEKAGLKAGDVITSLNGERVRSAGELREKLSAHRDDKDKTVKLGVLRNKTVMSITVELPAAPTKVKRLVSHRTNI
jgi:serine protease Do